MGSAYAGSLPQLGTLAKRFGEEIWRVSGGDMEIRFHEPGTLVPDFEMFDAVASGAIDAAFASPGRWGERHPALRLFAAVPFGPSASEYLAWIYFGGGRELFEEIHRRNSIHSLFCGVIAPEASGWFRKEVRTVEDLKGLKMGFLGLGAKVMAKLGVETVPLTGGNVFLAMERGTVDATEFSMPAIDLELGLYEMAKHYYFPGWHQPATLFALMINLDKWQGLGAARKARIEAVCGDNIRYGLAEGEALQFVALKKLNALGVILHRWPAPILEALEKAWREVAVEEATADADFKRVWESLSAFRREYGIWRELGHL
jgi:TRAP-type mannitol/chloroaromatic compound transport system substrate-binding protein